MPVQRRGRGHQIDRPGRHRRRGRDASPRESAAHDFAVVSNPEFLREGAAIGDFKRPDRVVVGAQRRRAAQGDDATSIARSTCNEIPILFDGRRTAELIKYAANAFLATKITFINEMADLCERVGADVQQVARGIGMDERIGSKFLHAGPGYGGSCFPKDTTRAAQIGQDYASPMRIVEAVVEVNDGRKRRMADKVLDLWAAAARARPSRAGRDVQAQHRRHARFARDRGGADAHRCRGRGLRLRSRRHGDRRPADADVTMSDDPYAAIDGADAVAIVTEWDAFRALDLDRVKRY